MAVADRLPFPIILHTMKDVNAKVTLVFRPATFHLPPTSMGNMGDLSIQQALATTGLTFCRSRPARRLVEGNEVHLVPSPGKSGTGWSQGVQKGQPLHRSGQRRKRTEVLDKSLNLSVCFFVRLSRALSCLSVVKDWEHGTVVFKGPGLMNICFLQDLSICK